MAFNYDASRRSPNYTPRAQAASVWGRARTFEAIAIHWWGDPNTNPTLDGVVGVLCNPNRGASAHFVASGTNRMVANLVDTNDASWATNSANPYTISIECDPRCRPEDYDVVGELIAQIRNKYGNLPLVPHKQFVATACPGNYDLNRLNTVANSKQVKSGNWGDVTNKEDDDVITKDDVALLRIINTEVKGWPFNETHAGQSDKRELDAWVGQSWRKHLWQGWTEGEGYRNTKNKWRDAFNALPGVTQERDTLKSQVAEKDTLLTQKDLQIADLNKRLSEATQKPQEPSKPENGTTTPPAGESLLQDLTNVWKQFTDWLSKYKRSK